MASKRAGMGPRRRAKIFPGGAKKSKRTYKRCSAKFIYSVQIIDYTEYLILFKT